MQFLIFFSKKKLFPSFLLGCTHSTSSNISLKSLIPLLDSPESEKFQEARSRHHEKQKQVFKQKGYSRGHNLAVVIL